jgi:molybdate transport system regulatory protein
MPSGPLRLEARLHCADEVAFGPSEAALLEAIEREGSISAAARALAMPYRRAWMLVDVMNRCWDEPLVLMAPGGSRRKGARLTDRGRLVLAQFRRLEAVLAAAADRPVHSMSRHLLASPREPDP